MCPRWASPFSTSCQVSGSLDLLAPSPQSVPTAAPRLATCQSTESQAEAGRRPPSLPLLHVLSWRSPARDCVHSMRTAPSGRAGSLSLCRAGTPVQGLGMGQIANQLPQMKLHRSSIHFMMLIYMRIFLLCVRLWFWRYGNEETGNILALRELRIQFKT